MCRSLAFKNSLGEPQADRNLPGSSSLQSFQAWLRRKGRDRAPASHCWQHWWICVWMSRQCSGSRHSKVYVSFSRPQIVLTKGSMSAPLRTPLSPKSKLIQTVFYFVHSPNPNLIYSLASQTGACFVVSMVLFLIIAFQGMLEILWSFEGLIAW